MPSRSRGARNQPTTKKGAYNGDHKLNRERLLRRHVDGKPCWWCGKPLYRDKTKNHDGHALEAHHTRSIARFGHTSSNRADTLLHKVCNIQCGDGTNDHKRPTNQQHIDTSSLDESLGATIMGWPTWQ